MTHDIEPIHAEQGRIVRELFVNTADDNYITARWCFAEGLNVDYFWLAVHTLEKYMKAALLLNGRSSRSFGHDIVALYEDVKLLASDLLPNNLGRPDGLETDHWRDETPEAFSNRLYRNGNADNRYQIFGFVRHREDLFKLDLMVFALRRLCVPLDAYYFAKPCPGRMNLTYRDLMTKQPKWWIVSLGCMLEKTFRRERGEQLREVFLNLNFPFATDELPHGSLRNRTEAKNPVLTRSILAPLERARDISSASMALELCGWVLNNIKLPKEAEDELRDAKAKWEM